MSRNNHRPKIQRTPRELFMLVDKAVRNRWEVREYYYTPKGRHGFTYDRDKAARMSRQRAEAKQKSWGGKIEPA